MEALLAAAIALAAAGYDLPPIQYGGAWPETFVGAVACHEDFRSMPGNAQYLCPTGFEGAIIYGFPSYDRALYLLAHETYHLNHTSFGTPDDPFREAEAHAYGCQFSEVC